MGTWFARLSSRSLPYFWCTLVVVALTSTRSNAWSAMRCGMQLIDLGDPIYKVKALCGEPDQESVSVEYRQTFTPSSVRSCRQDDAGRTVCSAGTRSGFVAVPTHELVYDFGRYRFVHYLLFKANRLVAVETGDYGVRTAPRPAR